MTHQESGDAPTITVLADSAGNIIAALLPSPARPATEGGPVAVGLVPSAGQELHELTLPDEPERSQILESFGNYRLSVDGPVRELVAKSTSG